MCNSATWTFKAGYKVKKARYTKRCIPYYNCISYSQQYQKSKNFDIFTAEQVC